MSLFILLSLLSFNLFAESRSYDRTWLGLFNKHQLEKQYSIWTEAQARMDNDKFTNQQLLLRVGLLKKIDDKNELGLIYAHVQTDIVREHRPTFQFTHTFLKSDVSQLSLRNRFEVRKLENNDAISGRYRGALRYQSNHFVMWDEPFLTFTREDWTGLRMVERNRFFIGPILNFDDMNLEVGYLNQYIPRKSKTTIDHILAIYLFY